MQQKAVDQGLIYTNVAISPDKGYMFFVGDGKYLDTSMQLSDRLSQRYGKPVESINILPNMPRPYMSGNFIVLNRRLADHMATKDDKRYFLPLDQPDINLDVSSSPYIKSVADKILESQRDLFINLFKSTPEMTLPDQDERIKVIGPDPRLFDHYDNKINQRRLVEEIGIPVPQGYIANSFEELVGLYQKKFGGDAFVTAANGFGGNGTEKVHSLEDIVKSDKMKGKTQFVISELLDLKASPASLGIVANQDEVLVVSVADQLMDGVNYKGTIYPSAEGAEKVNQMEEYTREIGKYLGRKGYRGFFGVDFMIDKQDNLYFVEINPRKIGSSPEVILAHKTENPSAISLPELEFLAVTEGTFGVDVSQYRMPSLHWGITGTKVGKGQTTLNYVGPEREEKDVFRHSGVTVLDHPGKGITYLDSGRLARTVGVLNGDYNQPREKLLCMLNAVSRQIKVA